MDSLFEDLVRFKDEHRSDTIPSDGLWHDLIQLIEKHKPKKKYVVIYRPISLDGLECPVESYDTEEEALRMAAEQNENYPYNAHWVEESQDED